MAVVSDEMKGAEAKTEAGAKPNLIILPYVAAGLILCSILISKEIRPPADIFNWPMFMMCAYLAVLSYQRRYWNWTWVFSLCAGFFNPVIDFSLTDDHWAAVNVATFGAVFVSFFVFNPETLVPIDAQFEADRKADAKESDAKD
jgi:hypothetical protein